MALTEEMGGRFFESKERTRFVDSQDMAARINGRLRSAALQRLQNSEKNREAPAASSITVRDDDANFEIGNVISDDNLTALVSLLEHAVCERSRLPQVLQAAGWQFSASDPFEALLARWFSGFQLPRSSSLYGMSPAMLDTLTARQADEVGRLRSSLAGLRSQKADCTFRFVPNALFHQE
jgi:hypothetical protein